MPFRWVAACQRGDLGSLLSIDLYRSARACFILHTPNPLALYWVAQVETVWRVLFSSLHFTGFFCTIMFLLLFCFRCIYEDLRLYVNFFQPVLKLVGKEQVDGKIFKKYDLAATPFRRVLASELVPLDVKARLTNLYIHLNPVLLRNSIDLKVANLWKIIR